MRLRLPLLLLLVLSAPSTAVALDTYETWDPRSVGIDMALGGGLLIGQPDAAPTVETTADSWIWGYLGLGVISIYGWVEGYTYGDAVELGTGFGLYATPIDTDGFDLDVGFHLAGYDGSFAPAPWVEFNLDFKPDMELAGLFARVHLDPWISAGDQGPELFAELLLLAAGYVTIDDDQLFLGWRGKAELYDEKAFSNAAVVGWNPGLADWGELVTEVEVGLPTAKGDAFEVTAFVQLSVWFGGE